MKKIKRELWEIASERLAEASTHGNPQVMHPLGDGDWVSPGEKQNTEAAQGNHALVT